MTTSTPSNSPTPAPLEDDLMVLFSLIEDIKQQIPDLSYKNGLEAIGRLSVRRDYLENNEPEPFTDCWPDGCMLHPGRPLPFKLEKIELYCSSKRSKPSVMDRVLSSLGREYTVTYCCKKNII